MNPKIKLIYQFFLGISLINPTISLAESILAYNSKPEFSQITDLCRNKANNMNFYLTSNLEKREDKFFRETFKRPWFLTIFGSFCP